MAARRRYLTLLKRLLRQWAIPPARQFNRLPSQARVVMCTELVGVWQYSRGRHSGVTVAKSTQPADALPGGQPHACGYALRQTDRIPPRFASASCGTARRGPIRSPGRDRPLVPQHDARWRPRVRLRGDERQSRGRRGGARKRAGRQARPGGGAPHGSHQGRAEDTLSQIIVAAGAFGLDQGVALTRAGETGFAVLTKLVEQGPGFEIYDYASVV
jgi:hypothetical protein